MNKTTVKTTPEPSQIIAAIVSLKASILESLIQVKTTKSSSNCKSAELQNIAWKEEPTHKTGRGPWLTLKRTTSLGAGQLTFWPPRIDTSDTCIHTDQES